nr:Unknown Function [uncultured bacterium]
MEGTHDGHAWEEHMSHTRTNAHKEGFFSTGRMFGWGIFLVFAGMAAPVMRSGTASAWMTDTFRSADARAVHTPAASVIIGVENRAKAFTTRSRMRGVRAELKLWTGRHGAPPTGSLTDVVGKRTATDAWGRRVQYLAPTDSSKGWLRSLGADAKSDKDDIWLPLALSDLR